MGAPVGLQNETAVRSAVSGTFAFRYLLVWRASSSLPSLPAYFGTVLSTADSTRTKQLDRISALYPDDPEVGCPFGTGDGVASSGLMDKRFVSPSFSCLNSTGLPL